MVLLLPEELLAQILEEFALPIYDMFALDVRADTVHAHV